MRCVSKLLVCSVKAIAWMLQTPLKNFSIQFANMNVMYTTFLSSINLTRMLVSCALVKDYMETFRLINS